MLDAWLWTAKKNLRGAPISPPGDFVRNGGEIKFVPSVFADRVAELLLKRGFTVDGAGDEEIRDNASGSSKEIVASDRG